MAFPIDPRGATQRWQEVDRRNQRIAGLTGCLSLGSGVSLQQFPDPQITSKKLELGLHLALPDKRAVSFVILSLPA